MSGFTLVAMTAVNRFCLSRPVCRAHKTYLQARDAGGVRSERGGAQVPTHQRVEGRCHRGVGGFPVGLEVFGKVFAGVLQLVLIQDDVKHFLSAAEMISAVG